jgi:hypothetical protein
MNKRISGALNISLLILIFALSGTTVNAVSEPEPTITFLGWESVASGIKFSYQVESGTSPSLSHWELISCIFTEGALVQVSETPYEYKPEQTLLKFDKGYSDGEVRTVWFIIDIDYESFAIGEIPYAWKSGLVTGGGLVDGPICIVPEFEIPEVSFGTLGALIPLLVAAGLFTAKNKIISIPQI